MDILEHWNGQEEGLPYVFPRNDMQMEVYSDLRKRFRDLTGDGWIQELIGDFLLNPAHVCMLSVMKSIASIFPESMPLYEQSILSLTQVYKRSDVLKILQELANMAKIKILVYVPDVNQWCVMEGESPRFLCRLIMTHDSIYAGWSPEKVDKPLGDIHLSDWQESYMAVTGSVLDEMFGLRLFRETGSYKLLGEATRTASEAAQRVLLHALQTCHLTSAFPYKIDKRKKFTTCIDRFDRIMNTLSVHRGRESVAVPPEKRPASAVSNCVMSDVSHKKAPLIEEARRDAERAIMAAEDRYAQGMREWELELKKRCIVRWREVVREFEVKRDLRYYDRIKAAKAYVPPKGERQLKADYDEARMNAIRYFKDVVQKLASDYSPAIREENPTASKATIYALARARVRDRHPDVMDELSRLKKIELETKEVYYDYDPFIERLTHETVFEINTDVKAEMDDRRNRSPDKRVTWYQDPVYAEKEARLRELRNISKKGKELGLELIECQNYVREHKPVVAVTKDKPHKVSLVYPPMMPSHDQILERMNEKISQISSMPDRVVEKKEAVDRKRNLELIGKEMARVEEKKHVICPNKALKARCGLIPRIHKARRRKPKEDDDKYWKGIKSLRPLFMTPEGMLDANDPILPRINTIYMAATVKQLVDSARRSLIHSGCRPSSRAVTMTNSEAYALASVMIDKNARKYLRMYLPNNIANKLCAHNGSLISQRIY